MEIAKAVVLAGPACGDRPWPSAPAGPKHLVPVANRPILFHNLEALRGNGLLEAVIAVGPDDGDEIERAVGDGSDWELVVRFADFAPEVGVAGALAACRDFVADEPVVVQHGDALLRDRIHAQIRAFARDEVDALALRLSRPAVGDRHADTPAYLFSPRAVAMLLDCSERLADPLDVVRASGGEVRIERVSGCLPCHGDQDALLESNRRVLERLIADVDEASLRDCEIQGPVIVHPTARLERSVVRGPAILGPRCSLTDAYVGPFSSIGADVVIEGSEIEHSIVFDGAQIRFVGARLESSVIGRNARVVRRFRPPSALRISIGDGAEVALS
jgi:glucose-1-phosphate thymidylyltransferase